MKQLKKIIVTLLAISVVASTFMMSASAGEIAYGAGTVKANILNIRSGPGTNYDVKGTVTDGSIVVILEKASDSWYSINYQGTTGYVSAEFITNVLTAENFNATGTVAGTGVRMRAEPNTSSSILGSYTTGNVMAVIGINNGWYKVQYDGKTGYIRSDLMNITGGSSFSANVSNNVAVTPGNASKGQQIADYAMQYVGYRYVYGGASPSSGFDCSGLVYYTCKQLGTPVSRTASQQYKNNGVSVSKDSLQPGDLVFFSSNGGASVTHVGVYIGNGQFVHASTSSVGVIISDLGSAYYTKVWYGAKRIV